VSNAEKEAVAAKTRDWQQQVSKRKRRVIVRKP